MSVNPLDLENSVKKYISNENKLIVLQRQNYSCAKPIPHYICPISFTNSSYFDESGYSFDFIDQKLDNNNVNNIIAICPNCFCVKKRLYNNILKQKEMYDKMDI